MAYDLANQQTNQQKKVELLNYSRKFIISPIQWDQYPNAVTLSWSCIRFGENYTQQVPNNEKGVYSFVTQPSIANHPQLSYLLYIGKTEKQSFRKRFKQYLNEPKQHKPRAHICDMLTNWPDHLYFYFAPISNLNLIAKVEDELIEALIPPCNDQFPTTIQAAVRVAYRS